MTKDATNPQVDAAHLHRFTDRDCLGPHRREDTERDNKGVNKHPRKVNRSQRRFHLTDSSRAINVEGEAEARRETREPVHNRAARANRKYQAPWRAHTLQPSDKEWRAQTAHVADNAPRGHTNSRPSADLPCKGGYCECLHRQKSRCGARSHNERVEDEEGEKLCAWIQLACQLAWVGLGERDLRQRRPSRNACAAGNDQ